MSLKKFLRSRERMFHLSKGLEVETIDAGGGLVLEKIVVQKARGTTFRKFPNFSGMKRRDWRVVELDHRRRKEAFA